MSPLLTPVWDWHEETCACASARLAEKLTASLKSPVKEGLNKVQFLYWRRLCIGIHFLLSVLLKGDDLLQKDCSKQLGRSNIASELLTKQSWVKALKSVTPTHSLIFQFCWFKKIISIFHFYMKWYFPQISTVLSSLGSSTDVNWKELKTLSDSKPALVRNKVKFWFFLPDITYQLRTLISIFLDVLQILRALTPVCFCSLVHFSLWEFFSAFYCWFCVWFSGYSAPDTLTEFWFIQHLNFNSSTFATIFCDQWPNQIRTL